MAVSGHGGRSVLQPRPESARRRLDLVDDEEAGEHGAAVEDHQLAVAHVHGVVRGRGGALALAVARVVGGADAAGDDAAHQHRPSPHRGGGGGGAGVRGAAAGKRAHGRGRRAEAAGGDARAEHAAGTGGAALEPHHLIAVGAAPRRGAARAGRRRPRLLEPRHRARRAADAEQRLHRRRRRRRQLRGPRASPSGREDQLHDPPRRVALRQLRHREERRAYGRRRRRGQRLGARVVRHRLGLLLGPRARRGLLGRGRRDGGVGHGVGGPAAERAHPRRRHWPSPRQLRVWAFGAGALGGDGLTGGVVMVAADGCLLFGCY
jgi:hypothetical protein